MHAGSAMALLICNFILHASAWQLNKSKSSPEIIFFFMLNSAEHEIISANKYENANNSWHFHIY